LVRMNFEQANSLNNLLSDSLQLSTMSTGNRVVASRNRLLGNGPTRQHWNVIGRLNGPYCIEKGVPAGPGLETLAVNVDAIGRE
jgi:hypothetical protein